MRIITGKYKGNLVPFQAGHIRPTTDRVKESLFNILSNQIEEARVLDLFSGTGSLGLEALSRGAREVVFVEQNKKSIDIIKKNLQKFKITEPVTIISKDVLYFLRKYEGEAFDIIFCDPPFTEEMADDVMATIAPSKVYHENSLIAIESGRKEKIEAGYGELIRYDYREFGDKFLSFFKKG